MDEWKLGFSLGEMRKVGKKGHEMLEKPTITSE